MPSRNQQIRLQRIEQRRALIKAEALIEKLHLNAFGYNPLVDPVTGKLTGEYEPVEQKDQIKVSLALLDKAMPNTVVTADTGNEAMTSKEVEYALATEGEAFLENLNVDELRQLAHVKAEVPSNWQ